MDGETVSPLPAVAALALMTTVLLAAPASAQESDTSTATIGRQNRAPVVGDDSVVTHDGASVSVDVFANDTDPDGDALELVGGTSASHGTVRYAGSIATYTPDDGFVGEDSFGYLVGDGRGASVPGTVRIAVTNARPSAAPASRPWNARPLAPVAAPAAAVVAPAAPPVVRPAARPVADVRAVLPVAVAAPRMGPSTKPYVAPAARQAARPATLPFTGPHDGLLPAGVGLLLGGALLVAAGRRRTA